MKILFKMFQMFIFILFFETIVADITVSIDENKEYTISHCILQASQSHLINKPQVVVYKPTYGAEMVNALINTFSTNVVPLIVIDKMKHIKEMEDNILLISNIRNCSYFQLFKPKYFKENIKYFIITTNETGNCYKEINEIGTFLSTFNVVFIISDSKDNARFLSFLPHTDENTCQFASKVDPIQINTCINGNLEKKFYLPRKTITDMKNCTIKAGLCSMSPLSIIENEDSLNNYDILENPIGSDVDLIKTIAKTVNAGVVFYYMNRSEYIPYKDRDYIKFILNGSLDICAGGLYRNFLNIVAYTGAYEQQGVIWIYSVERMHNTWKNLMKTMQGLYIFFLFYLCYSVVWNILLYFDSRALNWSNTFLYSWGALFGASSLQDTRNFKQQLINIVYLIMCIYLSIFVGVQLYSFLTIQRPPGILRSIEDLHRSGRTPYLNPIGKYFLQDKKFQSFVNTSKDCTSSNQCIEETLKNKGLTITTDSVFAHIQLNTTVNDEARLLKVTEDLVIVNHEMIMGKDSPIVSIFQRQLNRLFEAGICKKLFRNNVGILNVARTKKAIYNIMHNSYSCRLGCSITFSKCSGIFYLWMISCFISCCIFVFEILM